MKGFTKKGILILPKDETINRFDAGYTLMLKRSVLNLIKFFKGIDIELSCFTTDEVATKFKLEGIGWINSSAPEDLRFIQNNCEGMAELPEGENASEDLYAKARKKYAVKRGMDLDTRFEIAVKRDQMTAAQIIKESKLVITLENKNNSYFRTDSRPADQRVVIRVNYTNFIATGQLSGNPIDIISLLQDKRTAKPVNTWEV